MRQKSLALPRDLLDLFPSCVLILISPIFPTLPNMQSLMHYNLPCLQDFCIHGFCFLKWSFFFSSAIITVIFQITALTSLSQIKRKGWNHISPLYDLIANLSFKEVSVVLFWHVFVDALIICLIFHTCGRSLMKVKYWNDIY